MKKILTTILTLLSLTSFGQLIIYSTHDTSERYSIDTTKVSGDSSFVTVQHYKNGQLIHKEDQINIRIKANLKNFNEYKGSDLYAIKTIFHGNSTQWYLNGQLKCNGTFTYDKKNTDWKYWNEKGDEIPKSNSKDLHVRRKTQTYYIDGVKVRDDQ